MASPLVKVCAFLTWRDTCVYWFVMGREYSCLVVLFCSLDYGFVALVVCYRIVCLTGIGFAIHEQCDIGTSSFTLLQI